MDYLKESRGHWKLKYKTPERMQWKTRFEKGLWTCRKADHEMQNESLSYLYYLHFFRNIHDTCVSFRLNNVIRLCMLFGFYQEK